MNKAKIIKSFLLTFSMITFGSLASEAYPTSDIVDILPGIYHGITRDSIPCDVAIIKRSGQVEFSIKLMDGSNTEMAFDSVSNRSLKKQYEKDFDFRKEQDRSFSPETSNPWLIYYVYHGIPSIFGLYPQTDKLEVDWDNSKLFGVEIAVTYSNGSPFIDPNDRRGQSIHCSSLQK